MLNAFDSGYYAGINGNFYNPESYNSAKAKADYKKGFELGTRQAKCAY